MEITSNPQFARVGGGGRNRSSEWDEFVRLLKTAEAGQWVFIPQMTAKTVQRAYQAARCRGIRVMGRMGINGYYFILRGKESDGSSSVD